MFRALMSGALRTVTLLSNPNTFAAPAHRAFSQHILHPLANHNATLLNRIAPFRIQQLESGVKSSLVPAATLLQYQPSRTLTKFSLIKGKRKSVRAVLKRFKRLDWGIWIRTHAGRQKRLFKKSKERRRRLRQHIFTNSTQSYLLDKMVTSFWRRPKHYIDDPYAPYHKRDEFFATKSRTFKV